MNLCCRPSSSMVVVAKRPFTYTSIVDTSSSTVVIIPRLQFRPIPKFWLIIKYSLSVIIKSQGPLCVLPFSLNPPIERCLSTWLYPSMITVECTDGEFTSRSLLLHGIQTTDHHRSSCRCCILHSPLLIRSLVSFPSFIQDRHIPGYVIYSFAFLSIPPMLQVADVVAMA